MMSLSRENPFSQSPCGVVPILAYLVIVESITKAKLTDKQEL
jgi:hypothetical protein